ncbi:MAG: hypothetical protein WC979_06790 [Candidatus Pacearchaeota archaeon]|jgi:hypothetical protein
MKYQIQEGYEVPKTLDERDLKYPETPGINNEFFERFKTWEQIRAERYRC